MPAIAIEPDEWQELSAILRPHLPGRRVWAFGSRATGQLVCQLATLRDALDESRLPFKVDIVDLATVTPEFRARIAPEFVLVQEPG